MAKRSTGQFTRSKNDLYITPYAPAVPALLPHLPPATRFHEPCAGNGALVRHLTKHEHVCTGANDIAPLDELCFKMDAFQLTGCTGEVFLTNPPWTRAILHPLITHLSDIAPTWLLFDADWMHTGKAVPFLDRCRLIVSVGRVKWIAGSKHTGKDNAAWYLFDRHHRGGPRFIPRAWE